MTAANPLANPVDEARRLCAAAAEEGLTLNVMGGVGIALTCPSASQSPLKRSYADIDLITPRSESKRVASLLAGAGYEADGHFNALHGARRLFFVDTTNGRQLDVFVDAVEMCHRIDLSTRLERGRSALAPADLLLCKLQIVETNEKDLIDIITIILDHDFSADDRGLNIQYLRGLGADDWGLWRTVTMVAGRAAAHAETMRTLPGRDRVMRNVECLLDEFEQVPKSRRWRLRAHIGERVRWYQIPEESH
jgi:hypothetical protein